MTAHHCCHGATHGNATVAWLLHRGGELAGWIVPGAALALLPKCPACLAAWMAMATGLGMSIAAATYLRVGMVVMCLVLLTYLGIRRAVRHLMPMAQGVTARPQGTGSRNRSAKNAA